MDAKKPTTVSELLSDPQRLISEKLAASVLDVKADTLNCWRATGRRALPFVRIGGRFIRYRVADLIAFRDSHTVGAAAVTA